MNMIDIFEKGGAVVWILAGYSVIALTIVLERCIHFVRMGQPSKDIIEQLTSSTSAPGELQKLAVTLSGPDGAIISGVLKAIMNGVNNLVQVATRIGSEELQRMERGLRTLGFLGNTAPLLGLLGTIIGMIKAFMVIEAAGGKVDAQALAGGIWEAMITTGVGLAVSIPILLLLHMLEGMADKRANSMHHYASILMERIPHSSTLPAEESVHHRKGTVHAV